MAATDAFAREIERLRQKRAALAALDVPVAKSVILQDQQQVTGAPLARAALHRSAFSPARAAGAPRASPRQHARHALTACAPYMWTNTRGPRQDKLEAAHAAAPRAERTGDARESAVARSRFVRPQVVR